ncbi:hypothetical protein BRY73_09145 [Ochrobactrum sp. P6BS-III]|uniref:DUF1127 domain-containing protein n=1 Tax=unclassified Ochrobactrum TaxID=239106 RepID=UPI0009946499|nr:uncharacterized protein YjiS (DUF1127 family) [Ochrobactrum sp. P6BSIII]OOL17456.1 hypothetical protein BRY73_09145 [Ochrobactrum sp. P6BS-III]
MNYIRPTSEVIDVITILPNVDLESDLNARLRAQPPSDEPHRISSVWTWIVDEVRFSLNRQRTRRMLRELDDRQLQDIGIRRDEI